VYEQVAGVYIEALEELARGQGDVGRMASVASFFVSRIDTSVDAIVESRLGAATSEEEKTKLQSIPGRVAIANAKLTYQKFKEIFSSKRWQALAANGAHVQRLLWASTSTKNPKYRDVLYVEELIGRDTVNTIPPATMDAFREHGRPRASLEENLEEARTVMKNLAQVGISMDEITKKLLDILDGRVNIMTLHFVHPLEICTEVIDMCKKMSRRGIILRSYTPLLKGINDDGDVLKELFCNLLSECGIIPYYAVQFIETPGAQHFRVPLGQAMDIMRSLHNELSGQAIPNLIVYLPDGGGKYIIGPNEKINVADAGIRRVAGGYKISSPLYPDKCSFYPD